MVEIDETPYMEEIADRMAHYLFYRKHSRANRLAYFYSPTGEPEEPSRKATECYCTACHERFTDYTGPQAFKHNTDANCPRCGAYVILKQMDRGRKGIRDIDTFAIFEGEGNYLAIRACKAELTFPDPESLEPSIDLYTVTAYELRPGKAVQYVHTWPEGWHPKKGKSSEPSFPLGYYGTRSGYKLINQSAIGNTFLRYAFGDLYEEEWPAELILWLSRIAERPQLEYMMHGGLQRLACDYVYQHLTVRLNWRSNDLKKILRLTKPELAYIKEEDGLRYSDYIRFRRDIFRGRSPAETVAYHRDFGRCDQLLKEAADLSGLTARQIMNYARRKKNNQGGYFAMTTYRDYLRECSALGYDMTSTAVTMPKDLFAAHDKTMQLMREKQDLELAAKMAERCKDLEELLFQLPELGLMIKLPETVQDIIDEGAEKKLDKKHKDLLAAEKRAKEAQTELQELKDKLAAEAEKHREELEKVKAEAQKPADSGDKQSFKHAYAASYKELTGLLEIISSTDDKQERQIFQAKAEQLLALVGEKLRELEGAADE